MNNQIHNTRSAQSFFFNRLAEPIPAPFTFKFQSFTTLCRNGWMDVWMHGWMHAWMEGGRDEQSNERLNE